MCCGFGVQCVRDQKGEMLQAGNGLVKDWAYRSYEGEAGNFHFRGTQWKVPQK